MQVVFWLQNVIEYLECIEEDEVEYTGVNIVGLGTVEFE